MTADIHTLGYRTNGAKFPQVYRVSGFYQDWTAEGMTPSSRPAGPSYTLCEKYDYDWATPTITPIKLLQPGLDIGWVIVRHHADLQEAHIYLDGILDSLPNPYADSGPIIWETPQGVFTMMHRPPTPERPDHLLIFVKKVLSSSLGFASGSRGPYEDDYHIVHPDGTVTHDPEILLLVDEPELE